MAKAGRKSSRRPGQAGIDALTELTLNLRRAWHHGTDELWAERDRDPD